ncbi:MAG: DUF309 domain-containing protein [Chloroflexaceae bacterium]|nr:DUF309 domain-containing protein [Chloroflexaceae bacterium]NJO04686.1 DUF309 domain-containing protein [Chloroflexaceae bacterium]
MEYPEPYLEGIRLFNAHHFWHAHEQWEACWLASAEPDATFYKGIIQAAAALVHWQRHNLRGLELNWAKSRRKLASLPALYQGLNLSAFCTEMDAFVAACQRQATAPVPRLELREMARHSS